MIRQTLLRLSLTAATLLFVTPTYADAGTPEWPVTIGTDRIVHGDLVTGHPVLQFKQAPKRTHHLYTSVGWTSTGFTGFDASRVNDGDTTTSAGTVTFGTMVADFGTAKTIREVRVSLGSYVPANPYTIIDRLRVSTTSTFTGSIPVWYEFQQGVSAFGDPITQLVFQVPSSNHFRFWEFRFNNGGGGSPIDLHEFQVYEYNSEVSSDVLFYNLYDISGGTNNPVLIGQLPNDGSLQTTPYDLTPFIKPELVDPSHWRVAVRIRGVNLAGVESLPMDDGLFNMIPF